MPGMLPRKDSNATRTLSACSRRSSTDVPRTLHMTTCLIMASILTPTATANHRTVAVLSHRKVAKQARTNIIPLAVLVVNSSHRGDGNRFRGR